MLRIYKTVLGLSAYIKCSYLIEIRIRRKHDMYWKMAGHFVLIVMDGDLMIPKQCIGQLKCSEIFNHEKGINVYRRFARSLEHIEMMQRIYTALDM